MAVEWHDYLRRQPVDGGGSNAEAEAFLSAQAASAQRLRSLLFTTFTRESID